MSAIVVDTNVVSYIFKGHEIGDLYQPHLTNVIASISFMTLAELEQWAVTADWGPRRHRSLMEFIKLRFVVIDSSPELCRHWAEVRGEAKRNGHPIDPSDAWIAATARLHRVPLVTHNVADFEHVPGLRVITEK